MTDSMSGRAPVRPRWVWAGTAVGLVGFVLLGVAVAIGSWWVALAGAVVVAAGLAAAQRGRIWQNVHGGVETGGAGELEARQLRKDEQHPGVRPGDMVDDESVRRDAERTEAERRALVEAPPPRGRLAGAEAAVLLVVAAVLVGAELSFYPDTATGESAATTMLLPAILLALCGLRIVSDADHPHRIAGLVALAAGAGTVLYGAIAPHQETGTMVLELVCGAVAVLAAAGTLVDS